MPEKSVADRVRDRVVMHLCCDRKKVTDEALLGELGADSLDKLELVMGIEDEFSIEISDEQATAIKTVDDLTNFVARD